MKSHDGIDPLHHALLHHPHRSTFALVVGRFLAGLEDETNGAGGEALCISFFRQKSGRSDHSRHVTIVPASVHDTWVLGDEVVRIRLLYRKRVHVCPERDERTLTIVEFGDHSGSSDPGADGET